MCSGAIIAGPHVRAACARHLRDLEHGPARGLFWDVHEVNETIAFFAECLRVDDHNAPPDAQDKTKPFELEPFQCFIVGSLFGWQAPGGARRFRVGFVETGKGPLALSTPIATTTGWTTMGDIGVGDTVFDECGQPCKVTAVSPIFYNRACYRLRFNDGCEIVADAQHEWPVWSLRTGRGLRDRTPGRQRKGEKGLRTTADIAATFRLPSSLSAHPQARWNHRIDVAGPLNTFPAPLPVPPYTLGAWLGDGDSDCARLTMAFADSAILDEIRAEGVHQAKHSETTARIALSAGNRSQRARDASIAARLRHLGVLNNKHIPAVYLRASEEQRMALLQGLMDADGSALKGGGCELTLCHPALAHDAIELIRSLGFKPTAKQSASLLYGREVGRRWRIRFHAYADRPVFRLHRKAARLRKRPRTRPLSQGRMIVDCAPVPSVPVRCITVDSDSHLFLAGEGLIPTHNSGKSPLAAGIGLKCLTADQKPRAEVYAAAVDKEQAGVLFKDAVAMAKMSPDINQLVKFSGGEGREYNIAYLDAASFFRPISSESQGRGKSGYRPHCVLLDEIHEHPTNAMVEFMRAGTKGDQRALIFMITNSGVDRTSVCFEYHEYGIKVAAGDIEDDSFFSYICALDENEDPFKDEPDPVLGYPKSWAKTNPAIGVTFPPRYLAEQIASARGMPSKESLVRRLNFCEWMDAFSPWIEGDRWRACEVDELPAIDPTWPCFLALDLSSIRDLTSLAAVWPREDCFYARVFFWTPGDTLIERANIDRVPYVQWRDDGHLFAPPGRILKYSFIAQFLGEFISGHNVLGLAYDNYKMNDFDAELGALGIDRYIWEGPGKPEGYGLRLIRHGQGFTSGALNEAMLWMPASVRALETAVMDVKLQVQRNPVLTYNSASAVLASDAAGNRMWEKRKSTGRIDGIVALSESMGAATCRALMQSATYQLFSIG